MPENPIVTTVMALLEPTVEAQGIELYDLEYLTEHGRRVLRLYIEKEGGIGLDDCERISHAVEPILDAHDPIPDSYVLEVSSPGIERKLIKDNHFALHIGKEVEVKLYKPINMPQGHGRKKFRGMLAGLEDGYVLINLDGEMLRFPRLDMAYCRLVFT